MTGLLQESRQLDHALVRVIGPRLITDILRLIHTTNLFGSHHNHFKQIASELSITLNNELLSRKSDAFTLQMSDAHIFINGQIIKIPEADFVKSVQIRALFLSRGINLVRILQGVSQEDWHMLITALQEDTTATRKPPATGAPAPSSARPKILANTVLEQLNIPHIKLHASSQRRLENFASSDVRSEILEVYSGLVVKCGQYFEQLKTNASASARFIKRQIQKATSYFQDYRHVFIGLINLKIIEDQDFVHAVNTAIYAMFLAQELDLDRTDIVKVGMTAITQDVDRILRAEVSAIEAVGDKSHFQTNMTSVTVLSQMGATDVVSALRLVTTYERGFPYNKPLPREWYSEEFRPHLLSRIVEIARHYDLLIQGLDDRTALTPDLALQNISQQMGKHYDPRLAKLFINVIGIYPVGEVVLLSTGEKAIVVKSPAINPSQRNKSVAHRPTVKLIDGSNRLIDLCLDQNQSIHIVQILDPDKETTDRPGAFFFF